MMQFHYNTPAMTMAGALSVTPVHCLYASHTQQCPLSKLNSFNQHFMKLGYIVKYHNLFFKFDTTLKY